MNARATAKPTVTILGAYRLEPSTPLMTKALRCKYGSSAMRPADKRNAERHVADELSSVVLFELLISNRDQHFHLVDPGQPDSGQAASDERCLSLDGKRVIAEAFETPDGKSL